MAGRVISAYRRRGADASQSVALWFPMVSVVDRPPRLLEMPWTRRRTRASAQALRRRLVEGAISHLSGEGSVASLSVGIAARRTPMNLISHSPEQSASSSGRQPIGGATASDSPDSVTNDRGEESSMGRMVRFLTDKAATRASPAPPPVTRATGSAAIAAGQGFEVLSETDTSYYVRTADNRLGYVSRSALQRLPILPGDEVNAV